MSGFVKGRHAAGRRDRDDDLALFRELFKRENERNVTLLDPVSEEFEAAAARGISPPGKLEPEKKGSGPDFLVADEKNDYNWLKTPPATPLFPSLEMETNDLATMVIHKELPILMPFKSSKLTGSGEKTPSGQRPKSPSSSSASSSRSVTPRSLLDSTSRAKVVLAKPAAMKGPFGSADQFIRTDKNPNLPTIPNTRQLASRKEGLVSADVPFKKPASVTGCTTKVAIRASSSSPRVPAILVTPSESPAIAAAPTGRTLLATRDPSTEVTLETPLRTRRPSGSPNTVMVSKIPNPDAGSETEEKVDGRVRFQLSNNGGPAYAGNRRMEKSTVVVGRPAGRSSLDSTPKYLDLKKERSELQRAKTPAKNARTPGRSPAITNNTLDFESPVLMPLAAEARVVLKGRFNAKAGAP